MVSVVALLLWPALPGLLDLMGARGEAKQVALRFLHITLPSNVLMAGGMALSGALRAVGDGRRAMYVTLSGGIVTALLDPLLIFGAGLGVTGAELGDALALVLGGGLAGLVCKDASFLNGYCRGLLEKSLY